MGKHYNITITGQVQGVNFRSATRKQAVRLGIKGFVLNRPDGAVYIEAEGEGGALLGFIKWCKQGTQRAKVERVDTEESSMQNFTEFKIRHEFLWS